MHYGIFRGKAKDGERVGWRYIEDEQAQENREAAGQQGPAMWKQAAGQHTCLDKS